MLIEENLISFLIASSQQSTATASEQTTRLTELKISAAAIPQPQPDETRRTTTLGTVHQIIEDHGKAAALAADMDRRVVEAAAHYMADDEGAVRFIYSGWAQAALPHKRLRDDQVWQISSEKVKLIVEPGRRPNEDGEPSFVGVPYGSRARLIMLYLQTEALRTNSREVELGKSLRGWLGRLGISVGGKSIRDVREQAERISRCRLTFHVQNGNRSGLN